MNTKVKEPMNQTDNNTLSMMQQNIMDINKPTTNELLGRKRLLDYAEA